MKVARIERSEIRGRPGLVASRPRVSLTLNPGYAVPPYRVGKIAIAQS